MNLEEEIERLSQKYHSNAFKVDDFVVADSIKISDLDDEEKDFAQELQDLEDDEINFDDDLKTQTPKDDVLIRITKINKRLRDLKLLIRS
jgi:Mg2+ and Co2+ transporter CorA